MDILLSVENNNKNRNKLRKKITFILPSLIGHSSGKHLSNIHSTESSLAAAKAMETFSLHFPYIKIAIVRTNTFSTYFLPAIVPSFKYKSSHKIFIAVG